ncbi:elongation factor G-like protein EF-G2 [Frankia sp. CIT1]|uniref:elongation factor G-like protein EF-G2 n=1 Tax=Frankia sp. CIT1 TaxID=2880974 RepID=UPI001EF5897A|nr:elongation factor G-like protein EF-G2 [Frankia sp. CIT1]
MKPTTTREARPDHRHDTGVRNIVLVGHTGAGKSALAENLLIAANGGGAAAGHATSTRHTDHDDGESRQRTISLTVLSTMHRGLRINLLDTPGLADFIGDLRAGLRGADAALFVVSALDGVDGFTRLLWDECAAAAMPRAIAITRLDRPRADFTSALINCQEMFGAGVLPLYLPVVSRSRPTEPTPDGQRHRLVDLLAQAGIDDTDGGTDTDTDGDGDGDGWPGRAAAARNALIEGIIAESEDESLLDQYLAGTALPTKLLLDDLETAVARGRFHPVVATAGSGPGAPGVTELLDLFTRAFPSPFEHPVPAASRPDGSSCPVPSGGPDGPLAAEVIRTTTDPYVGRVCLVRVFSGTLRPDTPVHVCGHGRAERGHPDHDEDMKIGAISHPMGRSAQQFVEMCQAGDICAVSKLTTAETGDTLSSPDAPILFEAWRMPEPQLPMAIRARTKSSEDKLSTALAQISAEDPSVTVEHNAETGQLVLWCMGEAHGDMIIDRLENRYGVAVDRMPIRVPMRETLRGPARGTGRHVKQSGGHGQYAICHIEVEPLAAGSGREFCDEVVGGAVPRQFVPSVEKGVWRQFDLGVAAGFPLVDLRVRLLDGKAHSVDSSDVAFQAAGALALKDAARAAGILLLEPVLSVCVLTPDEHVGPVTSDLAARRGRVVGIAPASDTAQAGAGGRNRTMIRAEVPETEMLRYAVDIRSLTQGIGTFSRNHLRYEPMPDHLAAEYLAARAAE